MSEKRIFSTVAAVAKLNAQPAIAAVDHARADDEVAEVPLALGADLDRARPRHDRAAGHGHVLARPVPGELAGVLGHDAVVARLDVAVGDPHVAAVVWVDPVAVGNPQVVVDADALDEHVLAADQVNRPGGGVADRDLADRHPLAPADGHESRPAGLGPKDIVLQFAHPGQPVAVDGPGTGNGNVVAVPRHNQRPLGPIETAVPSPPRSVAPGSTCRSTFALSRIVPVR